jgi:hypothetical protein
MPLRARSSVGERSLHTREVAGSKPAAPMQHSRPMGLPRTPHGTIRGTKRRLAALLLGLVAQAHQLPDHRLVDLAALHALPVHREASGARRVPAVPSPSAGRAPRRSTEIVSRVSPYAADRAAARAAHEQLDVAFVEVVVDTLLDVCEQLDPRVSSPARAAARSTRSRRLRSLRRARGARAARRGAEADREPGRADRRGARRSRVPPRLTAGRSPTRARVDRTSACRTRARDRRPRRPEPYGIHVTHARRRIGDS